MNKIACVIGARPQFIKHFPLEIALRNFFSVITLHTGQHYDERMSKIFFDELSISAPNYQFQLSSKTHGAQTGEMLTNIENVLLDEKPELLLVYGDTNSTLAGALAATKLSIPVIHIEAGLRSFNKGMPEEVNRILTDHISTYLFCSSTIGVQNLKNEGIDKNVHVSGDLMKDALRILKRKLQKPESFGEYFFATFHRPYNTDDPRRLMKIIEALNSLDSPVVFPVHPRTWNLLQSQNFKSEIFRNLYFMEPVGYIDSLRYQLYANCIITDSGGIQKEAYWLKKKCITIRTETEWTETLVGGWNTLEFDNLTNLTELVLTKPEMAKFDEDLYGDGNAAKKIATIINQIF